MKKSELTQKIMQRVVTFEKRRTIFWLMRLVLILTVLVGFAVSFLALVINSLSETKTLELLTLFREDKEIIAEFWQDTLNTFWQEFPKVEIITAVLAVVLILIIFLLAKRKMGIARKKLADIAKYLKESKINKR